MLPVSIRHNDSMIFGAKVALSTFTNSRTTLPNMSTNAERANERNGFDGGVVTNEVHGISGAVDDVENAGRKPRFGG